MNICHKAIQFNWLIIDFPLVSLIKVGNIGLSASSESIYQAKYSRSRGSSIRHRPHRTSSRRNKENGSGSFRRKNSFKKSSVLVITENVKKLNCTVNSSSGGGGGSNTALNGDKILKVNFQNSSPMMENAQNKSHTVTFGETPIVVKVTPASKSHQTVPMDQELHNQS